jgi:sugar phosphate isomerase/epimerase
MIDPTSVAASPGLVREPRFSIIEFTTPALTFAEDLALYRAAGAQGIGIVEAKLGDDRQDLELFRASGLLASSCFPAAGSILPGPLLPGPDDHRERLEALKRSIQRMARYEPECCFVTSGPLGRLDEAEARKLAVDGLRETARAAADAGMTLAVELMHSSLIGEFGFMSDIPRAMEIIDEVDEPNVGFAADVWHLGQEASALASLCANAERVASLHLNDRREPTRSWCDRVLPGDGIADIQAILTCLDKVGFDGWYELEVISDDGSVENDFPDSLWKLEPLELVSRGRRQFLSLWEAHGNGGAAGEGAGPR